MRSSGAYTLILVLCMLAACGGHSSSQSRSLLPASPSSAAHGNDPYQQALVSLPADIRAEVDALVPPKGCNSALFIALKKSFVQAIASSFARGAKAVCTPPTGDNNKAAGLTVENVSGDYILSWNYRNIGDYDQGGTVSIPDITPIAMHFGHTVGTDPLDTVIDGDGSGTVGISDITPLARNFGVNVASYRVEESVTETGEYTLMGAVSLNSGSDADQGWMRLEYTLPDRDARWLRVVPLDGQGNPGVPSDAMEFGGSGTAPVIESVSPLSGATNAAVQFSAVVSGVGPFTYVWNFNGAATPDSSTDAQPNVTLSATSGDYDCSVEVTNAAGPTLFNFTVTVGAPPNATAVNPTGGVTGEDVQFAVTVTGDAPLSYAWDFGGGATPATSTEESPIVTLGAAGVYGTASVTVTNPFGESFFGFTLAVNDPVAPEIISVSPTSGYRGDEIMISAVITGTPPFTYDWDFGWAATPDESTDASPTITLDDPGVCQCKLDVTSPYGSDTYFFDLTVDHDPAYDEVEPNNSIPEANMLPMPSVIDWHCRLTETTDENDFFSFPGSFGDEVHITALLETDDPNIDVELQDSAGSVLASSNGLSDYEEIWYILSASDTYYIRCNFAGYAVTNSGDYWLDVDVTPFQMSEVENNDDKSQANPIVFPLWEFGGHCGGPGGYDGDSDDYFVFDADVNNRISVMLDQTDDSYDLDFFLFDESGHELASSEDTTGHEEFEYIFLPDDIGPFYLEVIAYDGSGFYEINGFVEPSPCWDETVIDDTTSGDLGSYSALVDAEGHPASFYYDGVNAGLRFAYSEQEDGSGNWNSYVCDTWSNVGSHLSAAMINGLPAVTYLDDGAGGVKFAICDSADGSGNWSSLNIDVNGNRGCSVAAVNGYPAIAYGSDSGDVYFAINGDIYGGGSWYVFQVTSDAPGAYSTSIIELSNGLPGIVYDATDNGELRFATCDSWDGSGTWSTAVVTTTFDSTSVSAALVAGNPAFAAVWSDRPTFFRNSSADGLGGWVGYFASSHEAVPNGNVSMAVGSWGWPRILFEDNYGYLYYTISVAENGQGEWLIRPMRTSGSVGSNRSLGYVAGNLGCVFYDSDGGWVGFARPSS